MKNQFLLESRCSGASMSTKPEEQIAASRGEHPMIRTDAPAVVNRVRQNPQSYELNSYAFSNSMGHREIVVTRTFVFFRCLIFKPSRDVSIIATGDESGADDGEDFIPRHGHLSFDTAVRVRARGMIFNLDIRISRSQIIKHRPTVLFERIMKLGFRLDQASFQICYFALHLRSHRLIPANPANRRVELTEIVQSHSSHARKFFLLRPELHSASSTSFLAETCKLPAEPIILVSCGTRKALRALMGEDDDRLVSRDGIVKFLLRVTDSCLINRPISTGDDQQIVIGVINDRLDQFPLRRIRSREQLHSSRKTVGLQKTKNDSIPSFLQVLISRTYKDLLTLIHTKIQLPVKNSQIGKILAD